MTLCLSNKSNTEPLTKYLGTFYKAKKKQQKKRQEEKKGEKKRKKLFQGKTCWIRK